MIIKHNVVALNLFKTISEVFFPNVSLFVPIKLVIIAIQKQLYNKEAIIAVI